MSKTAVGGVAPPKANWLQRGLRDIPAFFTWPCEVLQGYSPEQLRPDLIAGLTVAAVLIPQAIAYALIAELPPQMGLYAAIVAAVVGALWGSSWHLHTGPTNAISLLVLSSLLTIAEPGSPRFLVAAGLMAVIVGVAQLLMGMARMGVLVNFVSDSVIIGFTAGAALLISVNQLPHLLGLSVSGSPAFYSMVMQLAGSVINTHGITVLVGLGTVALMVLLRLWRPGWPVTFIGIVAAAAAVAAFGLAERGVVVLAELPRQMPSLASLPVLDLELIGRLSAGALAVSAIGLVEAISISRSVAAESGQRLDSNQEFVGQGLANIAAGFFSGYTCSGSFTRTMVNYTSGARTPMAGVFSGLWVLAVMLLFAPLAAYLPRTALAGVLLVTAYRMVNVTEMRRILRTSTGDSVIMVATLLATVLLPLEFAVLAGVLVSFGRYLVKTSTPGVWPVIPDENFHYFVHEGSWNARGGSACPQLGMIAIEGSLYFGAVHHVEEAIRANRERHPEQQLLLLRLHLVDHCDVSGIHMLEAVVRQYRERGGDVYLVGVHPDVAEMFKASGFDETIGEDHLLQRENPVGNLFHNVFDPSVCIYECEARVFAECQALAKHPYPTALPAFVSIPEHRLKYRTAAQLKALRDAGRIEGRVFDVRERREYRRGHISPGRNLPLRTLVEKAESLPREEGFVLVCRSGRRSARAAGILQDMGFGTVHVLKGGMLAWEAAGYPVMVE